MKKSRRSIAALALFAFLLTPAAAAPAAAQTAPVCEDIPDNSNFPGWIMLQTSPHSIDESAGETAVTITAEINGPALDSDTAVSLWIDWDSLILEEGVDLAIREDPLPTITIPAGETRGCATVHVDPIEDNIDEGSRDQLLFDGTHSGGKLVLASSGLWINDNDTVSKVVNVEVNIPNIIRVMSEADCPGLRLAPTSIGTVLQIQGQCRWSTMQVTVTLEGSVVAAHDVTVTFDNTLGGTASGILFQRSVTEQQASGYDYIYKAGTPAPWSLTIPAGSFTSPSAASIYGASQFSIYPIDDAVQDGLKTIDVSGSLGPLLSGNGWRMNPFTITLQDDESKPAAPTNLRLEPIEGPDAGQVGKLEDQNARLQWTAPDASSRPAHTSYRLERRIPDDHVVDPAYRALYSRYPTRTMTPKAGWTDVLDRLQVFSNDYYWVLYAINANGETASNTVSLANVPNPYQQSGGL